MAELLQSGALIDAILVLVALEALLLLVLPRLLRSAPRFNTLWPTFLSGVALMVAVRFALTDAPWTWVAGALLAALVAHLTDLAGRFRRTL